MQRIINDPDNIVDEMLDGFISCYTDLVARTNNKRVVRSVYSTEGRVGVVSGGGRGINQRLLVIADKTFVMQ